MIESTIPAEDLAALIRDDAVLTVGEVVDAARADGRCIGYRKYTRTPGRVVWYVCRNGPYAARLRDRCLACALADEKARGLEAEDAAARAENRRRLSLAIAPLRYSWQDTLYGGGGLPALIRDIEDAVRKAPGGTGNYWLALRLLAEMD